MMSSLSEYGCTQNGRDFGEIAALMSQRMTGVYSGGLMYEYAMEENGFGIVKIPNVDSPTVDVQPGFDKMASALAANPPPKGDGGARPTTHAVACPTKDANWLVDSALLPAIPEEAKAVCYQSLANVFQD